MRRLVTLIFFATPFVACGQFGISFHHSNLPFIGASFEISDRVRPELRIGTDAFLEDLSAEIVLTYDLVNKDDYEFYAGAGLRANGYTGLVIPIGLNFYPFAEKKFGFHIEAAPIFGEDDSDILRGSWGIRYRFRNE